MLIEQKEEFHHSPSGYVKFMLQSSRVYSLVTWDYSVLIALTVRKRIKHKPFIFSRMNNVQLYV